MGAGDIEMAVMVFIFTVGVLVGAAFMGLSVVAINNWQLRNRK